MLKDILTILHSAPLIVDFPFALNKLHLSTLSSTTLTHQVPLCPKVFISSFTSFCLNSCKTELPE